MAVSLVLFGQHLRARQPQIVLHPPEQLGAGGRGCLPERVPEELRVGQARHTCVRELLDECNCARSVLKPGAANTMSPAGAGGVSASSPAAL